MVIPCNPTAERVFLDTVDDFARKHGVRPKYLGSWTAHVELPSGEVHEFKLVEAKGDLPAYHVYHKRVKK